MRPASTISRGCSEDTGRYEEAEPLYREAMETARRRSGRTIRTMRPASTISRCCSGPPGGTRRPSRSTGRPWRRREGARDGPSGLCDQPQQSRGAAPGHRAVRGGRAALPGGGHLGDTIRIMRNNRSGRDHPDYATDHPPQQSRERCSGPPGGTRRPSRSTGRPWRRRKTALGTDHPDYANSLNNLGMLLQNVGATRRGAEAAVPGDALSFWKERTRGTSDTRRPGGRTLSGFWRRRRRGSERGAEGRGRPRVGALGRWGWVVYGVTHL